MNDKKRVWIYIRVDAPGDASSALEAQEAELRQYAQRLNCTVVGLSTDAASGESLNRPGLMQMVEAAQHGGFDILLVTHYENICCDLERMTTYICQLQALGLDVCSPSMGSVKNYDDFRVDADAPDSSEW